jgi:hypothetical protein
LIRSFVLFLWGPAVVACYGGFIVAGVYSALHPVLAPGKGAGMPAVVYYRQSNVPDLGALVQRAGVKHLMLAHLGPSLGSPVQGPWKIPGSPLNEADYKRLPRKVTLPGISWSEQIWPPSVSRRNERR